MKNKTHGKRKLPDLIPEKSDRCAVAPWDCMKRAALLFDKVYVPNDASRDDEHCPPLELAFGFTRGDVVASAECVKLTDKVLWGDEGSSEILDNLEEVNRMYLLSEFSTENLSETAHRLHMIQYRGIANAYAKFGLDVTPVYSTEDRFFDEYLVGSDLAYQALMRDVIQIDESNVKWDQIVEFRKDKAALEKSRALRRWLDDCVKSDSVEHATTLVNKKIGDYEWAIRKHGLDTVLGSLSNILDWKGLASVAGGASLGSVLGDTLAGVLAGGMIIVGKVCVYLAERRLDLEDVIRSKGAEISIISEINKKF